MGEVALSAIAGPVISSVVQDLFSSKANSASGTGGGLFDNIIKEFQSALGGLLGGLGSQGFMPLSTPSVTPYSTANMSPVALSNPMAQLQPAMGRLQEFNNTIVRDHRHPVYGEGGNTVVRDHRHNGGWNTGIHPGPIIGGTGSSNDPETAALNNAQAAADQAQQAMLADPDNVAKQLDFQKKQHALDNLTTMLTTLEKDKAQREKEAIQSSVLN